MPRPTDARVARYLVRRWYGTRPIFWLLPLAAVFAAGSALRLWLYRHGWWRIHRLPVPVIVVGNLVAGGAGKTPTVAALVEALRGLGWHPGVVSRGYGGRWTVPGLVTATTAVADCGDEALLLSRTLAVPVAVGRRRAEAARLLLAAHAEVDCLVSDDGLQHHALGRDLELVVIDERRGLGNRARLPAGPLRESPARLALASALLLHGDPPAGHAGAGAYGAASLPCWRVRMTMQAPQCLRQDPPGSGEAPAGVCTGSAAQDRPAAARGVAAWSDWQGRTVDAVAGIADPERFFCGLEAKGLRVQRHAFADHHPFVAEDLRLPGTAPILMTAKDAVKCEGFATGRLWQVPLAAQLPDAFTVWLNLELERLRGRKTA